MSILGTLEPHDLKEHPTEDPDWKEIYLYFSAILEGEEPPELSPIGKPLIWYQVYQRKSCVYLFVKYICDVHTLKF